METGANIVRRYAKSEPVERILSDRYARIRCAGEIRKKILNNTPNGCIIAVR